MASDMKTIDLLGNGNILKTILKPGSSDKQPKQGDFVRVLYSGRLLGSTEPFDSSLNPASPFTFTLGKGQVIKGWDETVKTMSLGEKCQVELKPAFGYGDAGSPPKIPPNSTLVFDIELLGWKSENALTEDGKVELEIKEKSSDWKTAKEQWQVLLKYKKTGCSDNEFQEKLITIGSIASSEVFDTLLELSAKKMKRGEKGVLYIEAGYLPDQVEPLQFDVECVKFYEVEDLMKTSDPSKLTKKILAEGEGYEKPKVGHEVTITATGFNSDGSKIVSITEPTNFILGSGELPEAVEIALESMKKNEKVFLTADSKYGWSDKRAKELQLAQALDFSCDIHLIDFVKGKDKWEMSADEKLEDASKLKEFGNRYFLDGKLDSAIRLYTKSSEYFQYASEKVESIKDKVDALSLSCHLNLAACYLKQLNYAKTIEHSNKALDLKVNNVKALYRRAQAYFHTQEFEKARDDCKKLLEQDPQSQEAQILLRNVQMKMKEITQKQRKIFSGMFNKLSFVSEQELSRVGNTKKMDLEDDEMETDDEKDSPERMEINVGK